MLQPVRQIHPMVAGTKGKDYAVSGKDSGRQERKPRDLISKTPQSGGLLSMLMNVFFGRKVTLGVLFLAGVTAVPCLNAQATGSISGTVTDSSGAAMADAAVRVKNLGTGIPQSVTSDVQGRYRAPDLAIGDYELQAAKAGFQTVVRTRVTLTVG